MATDPSGSAAEGGEGDPDLWSRKPLKWLKRPVTYMVGLVAAGALAIAQALGAGLVQHLPWVGGKPSVARPAASQTIPPTTASTSPARIGKLVASKPVDLLTLYSPSGLMGDTGDVTWAEEPGNHLVRMTYEARGRGPHEWEYKYLAGKINSQRCGFAGIVLLDGDWGRTAGAGYDLRGSTMISWEARSLDGNVFVQFLLGSESWVWDEKTGVQVNAPYPGSLLSRQLEEPELTGQWQRFTYRLDKNVSTAELQAVIAPFGWIIKLGSNKDDHGQPRTSFTIEVRKISYE